MFEFLFGVFIGVWMGQKMALPSVHKFVLSFWEHKDTKSVKDNAEAKEEEIETVPLFTGEMPEHLPSV